MSKTLICNYYGFSIISVQGLYNYIPATNHVSRVYNVAGILYLLCEYMVHAILFPMLNVLCPYVSTSRSSVWCSIIIVFIMIIL
jgi:hypothetical protein